MGIIDHRRPQALVGWPRPQAITLGRKDVETRSALASYMYVAKDEVVRMPAVVGYRRRQRPGQYHGLGSAALMCS